MNLDVDLLDYCHMPLRKIYIQKDEQEKPSKASNNRMNIVLNQFSLVLMSVRDPLIS